MKLKTISPLLILLILPFSLGHDAIGAITSYQSTKIKQGELTSATPYSPPFNVEIAGEASPDRQRVEPTIAVDPHNTSIVVAGAQDLRLVTGGGHRWHGYYRSTDRGQTWTSELLPGYPGDNSPQGLASPLHASQITTDPVLTFDRSGNLYYAGIVFNYSIPSRYAAFVAKYVNDGATYDSATLLIGAFADKDWIAVDTTGGPDDGNVYVAYDAALTTTSSGTVLSRSTNGGKTFSAPFYVTADQTGSLPGVTVDSVGNVYVSTVAVDPVTGVPLNYTQVSKITHGGKTLVQTVKVVNPDHEIANSPPGAAFRTFTIPQIASDSHGVYLVFDDVRLGNINVYLTRSVDGGISWSSPLRINDVVSGQHFFPTITAFDGTITVAWYDSRYSSPGTMSALDVFFAQSTDAGVTFSPSYRVTSASFNPNIVYRTDVPGAAEIFIGDYIGISSGPGIVFPIWTDNRNACDTLVPTYGCVDQDVFTAAFVGSLSPALQLSMNSTILFEGVRVATTGSLAILVANKTLSGTASVIARNDTTGQVLFNKTYTIPNVNLVNTTGTLQGSFLLSIGINPYPLSSNIRVRETAGTASVSIGVTRRVDIDGDGMVDIGDLAIVAISYHSSLGDPNYNGKADIDGNGTVDVSDLSIVALYYHDIDIL